MGNLPKRLFQLQGAAEICVFREAAAAGDPQDMQAVPRGKGSAGRLEMPGDRASNPIELGIYAGYARAL